MLSCLRKPRLAGPDMHAPPEGAQHAGPTVFHVQEGGRAVPRKRGQSQEQGLEHGGAHASERASRCLSQTAGEGAEDSMLAQSGCWTWSPNVSPCPSPSVGSSPEGSTCHSRNSKAPQLLSSLDPPAGEHPPSASRVGIQSAVSCPEAD